MLIVSPTAKVKHLNTELNSLIECDQEYPFVEMR